MLLKIEGSAPPCALARGTLFKGAPIVPRRGALGVPFSRRGTLGVPLKKAPLGRFFTKTKVSEKVPWGWVGLPSVNTRKKSALVPLFPRLG